MITSHQGKQRRAADDFALLSLRLLRCSDCRTDQLFERPPAETEGFQQGLAHGEWACTDCGAAYFDAIDIVIAIDDAKLVVA